MPLARRVRQPAMLQRSFFFFFFILFYPSTRTRWKALPPKPPKGLTLRQDDFCPILTESHIGAIHKLSHLFKIPISTSWPEKKIRFQVDFIVQLKNSFRVQSNKPTKFMNSPQPQLHNSISFAPFPGQVSGVSATTTLLPQCYCCYSWRLLSLLRANDSVPLQGPRSQ